jgi:hypothetical protein
MNNQFSSWSKSDKRIFSIILIWTVFHSYLLFSGRDALYKGMVHLGGNTFGRPGNYLYPFGAQDIGAYDYSEFFLYVFGVGVLFFIYKFLWK